MRKILFIILIPVWAYGQSVKEISDLIAEKSYGEAEILARQLVGRNPGNLIAIELLGDTYGYMGRGGYFWSADEYDHEYAYAYHFHHHFDTLLSHGYEKQIFISVRCVKNLEHD